MSKEELAEEVREILDEEMHVEKARESHRVKARHPTTTTDVMIYKEEDEENRWFLGIHVYERLRKEGYVIVNTGDPFDEYSYVIALKHED